MKSLKVIADNYGCFTIPTPRKANARSKRSPGECEYSFAYTRGDMDLNGELRKSHIPMLRMPNLFFTLHCKKNKDGTKTLVLNGKELYTRLGWRFESWAVPYLCNFLMKHEEVVRLNLKNNEINSAGFIALVDYTITHDNIKEIDLRNNIIGNNGMRYLFEWRHCFNIEIFRLSGNEMSLKSLKMLAMSIVKNSYIRQLDVARTDQSEESLVYYLSFLRDNQKFQIKNLKVLDLSRPIIKCWYSKFDSSHLGLVVGLTLRHNTQLEKLRLQKFNFYCHDIEEMMENAIYNKTLKHLDLNCNNIGDHGVEVISKWLQKRPALQSLLLAHNIISNHGVRSLSRAVPYSKLLNLDVSYNRFDDEGAVELLYTLKKSPLIEQLHIFGNRIGHPTAKIVKRMLLSEVLFQQYIDVRPYEVDGILYLAFNNERKEVIRNVFRAQVCSHSNKLLLYWSLLAIRNSIYVTSLHSIFYINFKTTSF